MHSLTRFALLLSMLSAPLSAAVEVILNGKAAAPGEYKPAQVSELTLRNGLAARHRRRGKERRDHV